MDQLEIDRRRANRMATIDNLPPAMRRLVHEYGYHVVNTAMRLGLTKPGQIQHMVETVLNEFSPTRGSYSKQGVRTEVNREPPRGLE